MRFDEVLSRSDGPAIAEELASFRTPGRYVLDGVHQVSVREHWQFRLDIDDVRQAWTLELSDGSVSSYSDGVLHDGDGDFDESFEHSTAAGGVVRMASPTQLLWWGRGSESLSPVLVQHVGARSILVTFEHREDPAFRTTLVVDEYDGIARRRMELGEVTFVTRARPVAVDEVLARATFEPLTDWLRPSY
ncbi:hypothetical protein DEJ28_07840 [Curtobacterium sp. MCPF17_002]|uniref:hypothetical protein n=1 Tax=Curtobacterium sp. MCPF17_002 TaxID=2175645 RepID=UPI000DA88896|nr:hypothetical protein [Curtobacterium sp. MCPF17_002]WIB78998.1 hypothetical protein DEJ28_07840 [Curtobacterium sp. MCPF17_002]